MHLRFFVVLVFLTSVIYGQGFLKRDNKSIVDGSGEKIILRGMGLGGWMLQEGYMLKTSGFANAQHEIKAKITSLVGSENTELFYDQWLANHCRKADVDSLASWGFNSIRLPMHYNLFTLPIEEEPVAGENTWLDKGFELTDKLLDWCKANEIYLILDLHAAPGGQGHESSISDYDPSKPSLWESEANRNKTVAIWKKIAERYADEPWIGGYDLINETNWDLPGNSMLRTLYVGITNAIREVDQNHIIFVEGNWFANDFTGLTPPWDDNMVYSFHKYWSYNDQSSIQWVLSIRSQHNVPIWCGEAGENSNHWFTNAVKLFEENEIGWAWWPMKKIESTPGPLSVTKSQAYQKLLDYWSGSGSKPSQSEAVYALMDLTEKLKIENCTYQKDVVDALIRYPQTGEIKPFQKHQLPGVVYAVDYDMGRNGSAYSDEQSADYHVTTGTYTNWNDGYSYRNDGVDIEPCSDSMGPGYNVGWISSNEWLGYTVSIKEAESYDITFRVASQDGGGSMVLLVDGFLTTDPISIPKTGGWQNWTNVQVLDIALPAGEHFLKLLFLKSGFNLNQIEFSADLNPVNDFDENIPTEINLHQNYPNPFNNDTSIPFELNKPSRVKISIFDINGKIVNTITNKEYSAGKHNIIWQAKNRSANPLASGVYFYQLQSGTMALTRKLILMQ